MQGLFADNIFHLKQVETNRPTTNDDLTKQGLNVMNPIQGADLYSQNEMFALAENLLCDKKIYKRNDLVHISQYLSRS